MKKSHNKNNFFNFNITSIPANILDIRSNFLIKKILLNKHIFFNNNLRIYYLINCMINIRKTRHKFYNKNHIFNTNYIPSYLNNILLYINTMFFLNLKQINYLHILDIKKNFNKLSNFQCNLLKKNLYF
jgi:hypothetical protein